MRFDRDDREVKKQIAYAIENGVNYFDTVYAYPNSEERLRRALAAGGYRNKVSIATKMPTYLIGKPDYFDKMFQTQLKRLQTDYIDYYLTIWMRIIRPKKAVWNMPRQKGCRS